MNPFRYPKARHQRGPDPGPFSDYRSYKPHLRREFRGQCVYCCMPDSLKGHETFGVDHYQPKGRFNRDAAAYSNLFYVCNQCNAWKGGFWPTRIQLAFDQFIPNPCDHEMFRHLRYQQWTVVPHSAAGEFAVACLDLNEERVTQYRRFVLEKIALDLTVRQELARTLRDIRRRLGASGEPANELKLLDAEERTAANLATIERHLKLLAGEFSDLPPVDTGVPE